mgnify:CR=1 FL=1
MAYHPHISGDEESAAHVAVSMTGPAGNDRTKINVARCLEYDLIRAGYNLNDGTGGHFWGVEVVAGDNGNECKVALQHDGSPPTGLLTTFDALVAARAPA